MKSIKSWLLLLVIYVGYLIVGGFIFHHTECPAELEEKNEERAKTETLATSILDLQDKLNDSDHSIHSELLESILQYVLSRSRKDIHELYGENVTVCKKWDFENSLFFSFTVVTTIGYGHQFTTTTNGRMVCLAYAIIGIPLNAILIGSLGSVFSKKFKQFKSKLWQGLGRGESHESRPRVVVVLLETIVFIFFFTSLLMLIPAAVFTALENDESGSWNYLNSVYYTFITLSTVGFGDMVPDRQENGNLTNTAAKWTYLILIILWIIIGMGYIFAVVDVLADTFRSTSKPVKKAFRGLKNQMLVNNDFWKKIINEIIMIKESDIKIDDSAILVGGGGSEPCLVGQDLADIDLLDEDQVGVRKAVSTSNIQDTLNTSFEAELEQRPKIQSHSTQQLTTLNPRSSFKPSENFLTVPGGHQRTRARSSSPDNVDGDGDDSLMEELNDDTITSLRQFITVAKIAQPVDEWAENNIPGWVNTDQSRQISRTTSLNTDNVTSTTATGGSKELPERSNSMKSRPPERRPSVRSTASRRSTRSAMNGAVGALLEQTTLGEFLTAVENVRKKSMMELSVEQEDSGHSSSGSRKSSGASTIGRKTSFLGKFVVKQSGDEKNKQFSSVQNLNSI